MAFVLNLQVLGTVTQAFSAVLAHMDRNVGILTLRQADVSMRDLWIDLFKVSHFADLLIVKRSSQT